MAADVLAQAIAVLYGSVSEAPTASPAPTSHFFEGTLVAYYPFDKGNATDVFGGHDGDAYREDSHVGTLPVTPGKDGGDAIELDPDDGYADYVELPSEATADIAGSDARTGGWCCCNQP